MNRRQFIISLAVAAMGPGGGPASVLAKSAGDAGLAPDVARIVDGHRRYRISAGALRNEKDALQNRYEDLEECVDDNPYNARRYCL